jgi:hypothetical protein
LLKHLQRERISYFLLQSNLLVKAHKVEGIARRALVEFHANFFASMPWTRVNLDPNTRAHVKSNRCAEASRACPVVP